MFEIWSDINDYNFKQCDKWLKKPLQTSIKTLIEKWRTKNIGKQMM